MSRFLLLLLSLVAGCNRISSIGSDRIILPDTLNYTHLAFYPEETDDILDISLKTGDTNLFRAWLHNNSSNWKQEEVLPYKDGSGDTKWCFFAWESQISRIMLCRIDNNILYIGKGRSMEYQGSAEEIFLIAEKIREKTF